VQPIANSAGFVHLGAALKLRLASDQVLLDQRWRRWRWLECSRSALLEQAQCSVDTRPTQPGLLHDLHHANTFSMQTDNLLAPFLQHFPRLLACIFFFHELWSQVINKS